MGQNIKTAIFGDDGAGISNGKDSKVRIKLGLGKAYVVTKEKIDSVSSFRDVRHHKEKPPNRFRRIWRNGRVDPF